LGIGILSILLLIKIFPTVESKIQRLVPYKLLVKKLYPKATGSNFISAFVGGLLNGLLPCGLVYVALAGATAMQDPIRGSIFMIFFGLGTLPLLLVVMLIGSRIQFAIRKHLVKWYPIMIGFMAILLIIRGLNLGNMLSPALMKNSSANIQCNIH
jgi:sulfite exporter TauE/SafE